MVEADDPYPQPFVSLRKRLRVYVAVRAACRTKRICVFEVETQVQR